MNAKQLNKLRIIFIVLLILLIFFVFHFTKKVKRFDESNEYFRQPIESQKVELWMTPHQIKRVYRIDIEQILGKKIWPFSMERPLSDYCSANKVLDCPSLLNKLNNIKNGH